MEDTSLRKEMCCPLNGKLCIEGRREDFPKNQVGSSQQCRWWVHMYGKDPQTEKTIDQHDCAVAWLPVTTVETAQMSRQTSAEVNEVRKEVRRATNFTKKMALVAMKGTRAIMDRLSPAEPKMVEEQKPKALSNGVHS